jgi:hypothetical protein
VPILFASQNIFTNQKDCRNILHLFTNKNNLIYMIILVLLGIFICVVFAYSKTSKELKLQYFVRNLLQKNVLWSVNSVSKIVEKEKLNDEIKNILLCEFLLAKHAIDFCEIEKHHRTNFFEIRNLYSIGLNYIIDTGCVYLKEEEGKILNKDIVKNYIEINSSRDMQVMKDRVNLYFTDESCLKLAKNIAENIFTENKEKEEIIKLVQNELQNSPKVSSITY